MIRAKNQNKYKKKELINDTVEKSTIIYKHNMQKVTLQHEDIEAKIHCL